MEVINNEKDYPRSNEEAEERYNNWKNKDPYPDIEPALLIIYGKQ